MRSKPTLVVIGGGAAGFFCAVNAARMAPGLKVVILEKGDKFLSKVRVSGGGRCNVTHACFDIAEICEKYPRGKHFVRKAFYQFFTTDTVKWFTERGVDLKAENDGRMFPVSNRSESVIHCLVQEANKFGVELMTHASVVSINRKEIFSVMLQDGRSIEADYVCIATGGFPKAESFHWICALGHDIEQPVPSLFTLNAPGNQITSLMGVAVSDAEILIKGSKLKERGPVLITHWGLSGPAVLRLSARGARELHTRNYCGEAYLNWAPDYHIESARSMLLEAKASRGSMIVSTKNPFGLPQRLWEYLLMMSGCTNHLRWSDCSRQQLNTLAEHICRFPLPFSGKTIFKEEFVTAGGVKTSEINPQTMESRIVQGLYFAGEVMDVDGITGGYNFQHAWTSGYIAAESIASKCSTGI